MARRAAGVVLSAIGLAVILFFAGVAWPLDELEPVRTTKPVAIVNVSVIDTATGRVGEKQTVVVSQGRISAVGTGIAVPADAIVVDGRGKYVVPALWDMHAHIYAIAPLLDLPLYIAYGVTNVRDMQGCPKPNDPFIACADEKRLWTQQAVAGELVGPRVMSSTSFMANGPGMAKRVGGEAFFDTSTPDEARSFVRHFAPDVEEIKVYDRIPREAYFALADDAKRLGRPVVGHRPHAVSAIEAAARQKSIDHARLFLFESYPGSTALRTTAVKDVRWHHERRRMLDEHDPAMAQQIFAAMKAHGTWFVPTHLTRWVDAYAEDDRVRKDPLLRYLHPLMKRQWLEDVDETIADDPSPEARETYREFYRKGLELTGAAHKAGVKVLAGTDYIVSGPDLHRELRNLVEAGLSPGDALRAATLSPAEYYGLTRDYGSVAPGKVADLLLLDANPLQDIRNSQRIAAVVFNGNLYNRAALARISEHVKGRARSWAVGCKIVWRFVRNPAAY